jgi:hypothetical protein
MLLSALKIHYSFNRWHENTESFVFDNSRRIVLENKYYIHLFVFVYAVDCIEWNWSTNVRNVNNYTAEDLI